NHLKLLRESGMLEERREGAFVLVRRAKSRGLPDDHGLPEDLWGAIEARLESVEGRADDLQRLERVLEQRRAKSREFFARVAPEWDVLGSDFKLGTARLRAVTCLVPHGYVVADVGCGTGYMARALVRVAARVICIDHSAAMLAQAKERLVAHLD